MEGSVLVIGGGIGGIQTSLDLTELGFKVYLIEREPSIGGRMAQFDKLFPEMNCSLCSLAPKMVGIYKNPNIVLLTLSKVIEVKGEVGNFTVSIKKKPRYVNETKCRGCGDCAKKCPKVEAPNIFDMNLGKRKSIYIPFPQATPPIYLIDDKLCLYLNREVCGVCQKICKAGAIDYEQKEQVITIKVGAIIIATGFHMLGEELDSKWGYKSKNVINGLEFERILSPSGPFGMNVLRPSDEKPPKKIAFIHCASSGYSERDIPYCSRVCCMYTTKNGILAKQYMEEVEISIFRHHIRVFGRNFYEYTKKARETYGIQYFHSKIMKIEEDSKKNDILIYYEDLNTGLTENVYRANLAVLASPLVPSKGTDELARVLNVELDDFGFFKEKSYFNKSLSTREGIFLCGFCHGPMNISETVTDASGVASQVASTLKSVRHSLIKDKEIDILPEKDIIHITPMALIIGGGISGMSAALNISQQGFKTYIVEKEKQLGGNLNYINTLYPINEKASIFLQRMEHDVKNNKNIQVFLNSKVKEIKGAIGNYEIKILSSNEKIYDLKTGVIIIATGSKEYKPSGLFQYNEKNNMVITQLELEKLLKQEDHSLLNNIDHITTIMCVNARQKGGFSYCSNICCSNTIKNINILKKSKPELEITVLFRELHMAKKEFEEFTSERKNMAKYLKYDLENIPLITKINNEPEKYEILLKDLQNFEEDIRFKTDLIILSTPLVPPDDLQELSSMLSIPIDENGYFTEAHKKLRPLDFIAEGVFICGCAKWPKNVQDSIIEAKGAAGRASRYLTIKEISSTKLETLSFLLSIECYFKDMRVNVDKCNGCGRCEEECQFNAISLIDFKQEYEDVSIPVKKAFINPAICKGCGRCAATCRLKAIEPRHYDLKEIEKVIDPYFIEKVRSEEQSRIQTESALID